jgi:hypothetical protein
MQADMVPLEEGAKKMRRYGVGELVVVGEASWRRNYMEVRFGVERQNGQLVKNCELESELKHK